MACNWLKMAHCHLFKNPKWPRVFLEKHIFDPFLDPFLSQSTPFYVVYLGDTPATHPPTEA